MSSTESKRRHRVIIGQETFELPKCEYRVLNILLQHQGQFVSRGQLEDSLHQWGCSVDDGAIEIYINALRNIVGPDFIQTVENAGYKLLSG